MSAKLMGQAFEYDLAPRLKLLLLAIADHANDDGLCYPSQKRLAVKVACSVRQIRNLIATLVSGGFVEIVERGNGRGKATLYQLPWATELKAEKAEISTLKAETAIAAQPSIQPSESSEPSDQSVDPPSPPPTAASAVANFLACSKNERVGKLIELGDALSFPRNGGLAAALVRDFGDNRQAIIDAAMAYVRNHGLGEPGEYMRKVLGNGQESQVRNIRLDTDRGAGDSRPLLAQGIAENIVTEEEARRLLAARARAEGGGGSGSVAQSDG